MGEAKRVRDEKMRGLSGVSMGLGASENNGEFGEPAEELEKYGEIKGVILESHCGFYLRIKIEKYSACNRYLRIGDFN